MTKMSTAPNVTVIPAKVQTAENRDKYHQLRVAAYCRVSTEQEEQQNSFAVQVAYYTDLINKKKEWTLAGIFADEGISGTQTKKRTEFNRMIRMCNNKKIDLIITKSISRFSRNTVDCLQYIRQLKELGIGVIFEKENINTLTMTSEFMIALYGSFAQAESESISKNILWGKEKAYREGKVPFQYKKLLGYRKGADGKPEIVPKEAETVRSIFNLYLDGYTLLNIAQILMDQKITTATGKSEWTKSAIQSILKNEKYVGDALLQKTFTVDCITHKVVKNNGERPMYLVTDHHTPIIDRDTFDRVQQEIARRNSKRKISDQTKTEKGKYSGKYALSELLICGQCGTPYRRRIWTKGGNKQVVWRCISRLEHGRRYCPDSPTIKEENLHRGIIRAINNYYSCCDDIKRILKANISSVLKCQGREEILAAEKRLKEIDQARTDLINLIASGGCDEDKLDGEFAKLYAEEQDLNERLKMLRLQNQTSAETQQKLDRVTEMIEHEKFELETFDNVLVRKLIECIKVLSKNEILVIFKGGYEVRTEIE
ncbi:recombinase family protein [uncultured Ruminococcus sp.]|uniref:recombinase family protein n=1 Tax=uncultured Ruminococcus sp. TaxID=165186 RepID=UPI0025F20389|nr:recombinase family protein [uncultured Ruminococcus sp.]